MKIALLIGCMASGKDTILKEVVGQGIAKPVISHTTRPMRKNEQDGVEYYFTTDEEMLNMKDNNEFIEFKQYQTADGSIWYYGINKSNFDLNSSEVYITIVDIKGMKEIKKHLKRYENVEITTFFIDADKEIRKSRSMSRDDITPKKEKEIIRRMKDDEINVEAFKKECDWILRNENYLDLYSIVRTIALTLGSEKLKYNNF